MKKLIIGLALSTIAMTAFAQTNAVKQCQLTEWCPLERTSDVVQFPVNKDLGDDYDCVLSAEGKGQYVTILVDTNDAYQAESGQVSVSVGQSALYRLKGNFNAGTTGLIHIRRVDTQANVKKVFVQCEKAFA
jgi:hypothetical protein